MIDTYETEGPRDFRFDEFLNFAPDALGCVVEPLAPLLDLYRKRKPTAAAQRTRNLALGAILANALAASSAHTGPRVHYSRGRDTYTGQGPYHPDWLGYRQLVAVVDVLVTEGFLDGETAAATGMGDEPQSTFWASSILVDWLKDEGVTTRDLVRDMDAAPTVILKGPAERGRKPWLRYPRQDPAIVDIAEPVRAYNRFLAAQALEWAAPPDVIEAVRQRRDEQARGSSLTG